MQGLIWSWYFYQPCFGEKHEKYMILLLDLVCIYFAFTLFCILFQNMASARLEHV